MPSYEYKIVPAPSRGKRTKGVKGTELRFANALQEVLNEYGGLGWDYLRTDTLPCDERQGLTGRTTVYHNMLVFRRDLSDVAAPTNLPPVVEDNPTLSPKTRPQIAHDPASHGLGDGAAPKSRELGGVTKDTLS